MAYPHAAPVFTIVRNRSLRAHSSELGLTVVAPDVDSVLRGVLDYLETLPRSQRPRGFFFVHSNKAEYYRWSDEALDYKEV